MMEPGKAAPTFESAADRPVFAARITPHRSLGREGYRIVMILCCLATVVASVPFLVMGFWPVAGFFGLDLLALAIAFQVNYRSGRTVEEVILTPIELLIRRISHRGERFECRFNPLWTRIQREEDDEFGLLRLTIVSRGDRVVIARELSPPERESLADELGRALADVKRKI